MARPQQTTGASRVRPRAVALAALLTLTTAAAAAAQQGARARGAPKPAPRISWGAAESAARPQEAGSPAVDVQEQEPNDTHLTATLVSVGDVAVGVVGQVNDIDYFAVDLPANTTVDLEVEANRFGSQLDPWLDFYAPDGTTLLTFNDDYAGLDSRVIYTVSAAGRYYFAISDYDFNGGPGFTYRIIVRTAQPGPGDPTTLRSSTLPSAWAAAAAPGLIYVITTTNIARYSLAGGGTTTFVSNLRNPLDLAVDGLGNLLVAEQAEDGRGVITRIRPDGTRSQFAPPIASATAVAVGPDGHVWVADPSAGRLHRYDPFGAQVGSTAVSGLTGLTDMAFSPTGVLHVSDFDRTVFRLQGGALQPALTYPGLGGIAFDRDGYLYIGTVNRGIVLFSPTYQMVHDPFAIQNLVLTGNIVFARNESGGMTSRLFALNFGEGALREVNPAGVRAPGFRIGIDLLVFATQALKPGVVGAAYADTLRLQEPGTAVAWSIASGQLPPGITLNSSTGVLAGVPETHGSFSVSLRAEGGGRFGQQTFTLQVTRPVVDAGAAANHLLGQETLSPELRTFLDLQGNRNGRFDIGDLRAYLRTTPGGAQATGNRN